MSKLIAGKTRKRVLAGGVAVAVLVAAGGYGAYWERTGRYLQSTDDANFQADFTTIAPKVSGYIAAVLVDDNQTVQQGQVLARIDDRDLKTALDQARADVAAAAAAIQNIAAQITLQHSAIDQANAGIASDQAGVAFAAQDDERYRSLVGAGVATIQRTQQAHADLRQKAALLQRDRAALVAAQQQVEVLQTELTQAKATLDHSQAIEQQAELNQSYATITAPIAGTVGARALRVGQYVQAGTPLMAVVPLDAVYVVGNFKETQLTHMRGGEPVQITVDSFPGAVIHGHVDSLAPASGLEFSLLPPDNATGNFTKIVQRIPVKIAVDPNDPLLGRLRPGMSVEATVNTKLTELAETQSLQTVAQR